MIVISFRLLSIFKYGVYIWVVSKLIRRRSGRCVRRHNHIGKYRLNLLMIPDLNRLPPDRRLNCRLCDFHVNLLRLL